MADMNSRAMAILSEMIGATTMLEGVEKAATSAARVRCTELGGSPPPSPNPLVEGCALIKDEIAKDLSIPEVRDFVLPSQDPVVKADIAAVGDAASAPSRQRIMQGEVAVRAAYSLGVDLLVKLHTSLGLKSIGVYDARTATGRLVQWGLVLPPEWGKTTNNLLAPPTIPSDPWQPPQFLKEYEKAAVGPLAATVTENFLGMMAEWLGHWDSVVLEEATYMIAVAAAIAADTFTSIPSVAGPEGTTGPGSGGEIIFKEPDVITPTRKSGGGGLLPIFGLAAIGLALVLGKRKR